MNDVGKGVLWAFAAYAATMTVCVGIAVIAVIVLMIQSITCSGMVRALLIVWSMIGAVCIGSVIVYGMLIRRYLPELTARTWIVAAYAAVVLASFLVFAFGLMILFNC